ncbi:hypothetical protein AMTRI_Chr08g210250 [Amborella trichopoda]|uniref:Uncharacterized protein n=1 Tax=Amborella trichopoda TaxID=13333 RepID=W1P8M4_AMBTC|nr:hypothetical protein AMTR_s00077p00166320 [Amborella trichopoda]
MKENGKLIEFKKRISVKEVLASYQSYKLVLYGSDQSIMPDSGELEVGRLYFLVPEKLAGCNEAYEEFRKTAEVKGLIRSRVSKKGNYPGKSREPDIISGQVVMGQHFLFEASELHRSPTWRPSLQTIPEIASPRVTVYVIEST